MASPPPVSFLSARGYAVAMDGPLLEEVREALTVSPIVKYLTAEGPEAFPVFRRNDRWIYVPKFWGLTRWGTPSGPPREREGEPIFPAPSNPGSPFEGALRPDQREYVDLCLSEIRGRGGVLAAAPTGSGKTAMALYIVSVLRRKTLIIVHKEFLLNQWIERIQQFLPAAQVGTIRQDVVDVEGKDIVIAMLQTIYKKTEEQIPSAVYDSFGLTIVDECHHICCRSFSKALFKVHTARMLGLSATPQRTDGLTKVLEWFLGRIVVKPPTDNAIPTPEVRIITALYDVPPEPKYNFKRQLILPDLINKVVADGTRTAQIVEIICDILRDEPSRQILVLSERRAHCETLRDLLLTEIGGRTVTTGLYIGQMTNRALNEANGRDVIFATYQIASEGYDNPKLDTLVMATGRSNVVQTVGRVLRRANAHRPLIVDLVDPLLMGQAKHRMKLYRERGYTVVRVPNPVDGSSEEDETPLETPTVHFIDDDDA